MAVDSEGSVRVTGTIELPFGKNYLTLRLDLDGTLLWVRTYGDQFSNNRAKKVAVDRTGNCYVTGEVEAPGGAGDIGTVKYDPNGVDLWVRTYDSEGRQRDSAESLVASRDGGCVVGGWARRTNTNPALIVKYDSNGNMLWSSTDQIGSQSSVVCIAEDSADNVVAASMCQQGDFGYLITKYGPMGQKLWQDVRIIGDIPRSVVTDNLNNVIVSGGGYFPQSSLDYVTYKYSPDGVLLWKTQLAGNGRSIDYATSNVVDENGSIYVTGITSLDQINLYFKVLTVKYFSDGTEAWRIAPNYPCLAAWPFIVKGLRNSVFVAGTMAIRRTRNFAIVDYLTFGLSED
jgi:hypothetical protein